MKYIISETSIGMILPLVFADEITHYVIATTLHSANARPISAGFVAITDNEMKAYGSSDSLNMHSKPEDTTILKLFLKYGISGLELQNLIHLKDIL